MMRDRLALAIVWTAFIGSCDSAGSGGGPDAPGDAAACEAWAPCDTLDAACVAGDQRCECRWTELGSPHMFCESVQCPEPATLGEPCTMPGLQCDSDGYDYSLCMGADPVWVWCQAAKFGQHCPATAPSAGDLCCVVSTGAPESCPYPDGSVWLCVSNQWTPQ